ncbi:hypothetical protein H0H92_012580, partial [Tricholoma furcatifolium]
MESSPSAKYVLKPRSTHRPYSKFDRSILQELEEVVEPPSTVSPSLEQVVVPPSA